MLSALLAVKTHGQLDPERNANLTSRDDTGVTLHHMSFVVVVVVPSPSSTHFFSPFLFTYPQMQFFFNFVP
jgi:hypothetical protein